MTYRLNIDEQLMLLFFRRRNSLNGQSEALIGQVEMWKTQKNGRI